MTDVAELLAVNGVDPRASWVGALLLVSEAIALDVAVETGTEPLD